MSLLLSYGQSKLCPDSTNICFGRAITRLSGLSFIKLNNWLTARAILSCSFFSSSFAFSSSFRTLSLLSWFLTCQLQKGKMLKYLFAHPMPIFYHFYKVNSIYVDCYSTVISLHYPTRNNSSKVTLKKIQYSPFRWLFLRALLIIHIFKIVFSLTDPDFYYLKKKKKERNLFFKHIFHI